MANSNQTTEFFDTLAKVLLRCTVLGFLLLLFWFGAVCWPVIWFTGCMAACSICRTTNWKSSTTVGWGSRSSLSAASS